MNKSQFDKEFFGKLNIVMFCIGVSILLLAVSLYGLSNISFERHGITLSEFNNIENGMEYKEVVDIIGEEGIVLSDVDLGIGNEYATTMYYWYSSNKISNANVTFQGGVVVMKAQIGLH